MSPFAIMSLYGLSFQCVYASTWYPGVYYLDENCGNSLPVFKDAIIKISSKKFLPEGNCSMNIYSSQSIYLVASVLKYSMNKKFVTDTICLNESIQLSSSSGNFLLGPYGYCKSTQPTGQYFLYDRGTYSYTSIGGFNDVPDIHLLVSEIYRDENEGCRAGYLECSEYICIDQYLKCNGYDDCGNGQDEKDCFNSGLGSSAGLSGWEIFGIVVACFIGAICLCGCMIYCAAGKESEALKCLFCVLFICD